MAQKYKAIYKGVEIKDGDLFNPMYVKENHENQSHWSDSYECQICNLGILWTNKLTKLELNDYVEVVSNERKIAYYRHSENLHLLSEGVKIVCI